MLQQEEPDDYVLGTGKAHTVQEFVEEAFGYAGLDWHQHVKTDSRYLRPAEVDHLRADASKAGKMLGWRPRVSFRELVHIMVDADLEAIELEPIGKGKMALAGKFGEWHQWDRSVSRMLENVRRGTD